MFSFILSTESFSETKPNNIKCSLHIWYFVLIHISSTVPLILPPLCLFCQFHHCHTQTVLCFLSRSHCPHNHILVLTNRLHRYRRCSGRSVEELSPLRREFHAWEELLNLSWRLLPQTTSTPVLNRERGKLYTVYTRHREIRWRKDNSGLNLVISWSFCKTS